MPIHLMITDNTENTDMLQEIKSILVKSKNFLYLCATKNIKDIRLNNKILLNKLDNKTIDTSNIYTFLEFMGLVKKETFNNLKSITHVDQQFILTKIIQKMFARNKLKLNVFYNMRYQLFELYDFLIFNDKTISKQNITEIRKDFSSFEKDVFDIYLIFSSILNKIVNKEFDDEINKFLGKNFKMPSGNCLLLNDNIKNMINNKLQSIDTLFYDSFLFLNDMQKYVLNCAINLKKDVYLTIQENVEGSSSNTFLENIYNEFNELKVDPKLTKVFKGDKVLSNTALNIVKSNYPTITNKGSICKIDDSIKILPPFITRDEEFMFIAKSISKDLKQNCGMDTQKIKDRLNNKIAVVIAIKDYDKDLQRALDQIGVFIFKGKDSLQSIGFDKQIEMNFKSVYFEKDEFLNEDIHFENGVLLTFKDKFKIFDLCFDGITINRIVHKKQFAAYPITQYIFKIYQIFLNGIDIESFKIILYANWYNKYFNNSVKWDTYLTEFRCLEPFLEDGDKIDSWIQKIDYLSSIKQRIDEEGLFKYHPLKFIRNESFEFFIDTLNFINTLIKTIEQTTGGISEHIKILKDNILNIYKTDKKNSFDDEEQIIIDMIDCIDKINTSSIVSNIDARYFAENLSSLLREFESETKQDDNIILNLNIVTLENVKHYDICYFPMLESNKYPRAYHETFPYSKEILTILGSYKYGLNISPLNYKSLDCHLSLEKYLFKNVLNFTEKQLIITRIFKEDDKVLEFSPFVEDICTIFDKEIEFNTCDINNLNDNDFKNKKIGQLKFKDKKRYSLVELSTFKLCPKLYFHLQRSTRSIPYLSKYHLRFYFISIVYTKFLYEFKKFNKENSKVYLVHDDECFCEAINILSEVFNEIKIYFPLFTEHEFNDFKISLTNKVSSFFECSIYYNIDGSLFTMWNANGKVVECKEHELLLEYDTKVLDIENEASYISQSDIYLDFLVLKTEYSENKNDKPLKRFSDMLAMLDKNPVGCDRINIVSQIMNKINSQFDSKKLINDEKVDQLIDDILNFDFSCDNAMPSKFCVYCKLNHICKESRDK